jgi:hypothetical protein
MSKSIGHIFLFFKRNGIFWKFHFFFFWLGFDVKFEG